MTGTADITVLATGGTIDKIYAVTGQLEIGPPAARWLLDTLTTDLRIEVRSILAKDSLDITSADRRTIADALDDVETPSVVITHGTDTLTDTAEYLRQHAAGTSRVIVLTGALRPAAMIDSDAALNLGAALMASQTLGAGVYVCMGGRVFPAGAVRKDASTGRFLTPPARGTR
ncbi:MAG: asparaginase [Actinobacteria bacterium]|nr:asparaginase [Actinomycetota bacterium]